MIVSSESSVEELQSILVGDFIQSLQGLKGIIIKIDIVKRQNRMTFYFTLDVNECLILIIKM